MHLIYYSHSYRQADAGVVRFFARLMRNESLIPSLDPPSASLNSAKPERHLCSTDGMVAVLTARESGVSAYILYEISLCLRARKPVLVFVEDVLPDDLVPRRILQRRFNRKALLRQVRDHRHALGVLKAYIGVQPPPRYQPHLGKRSCVVVGAEVLASRPRRGLLAELEALRYRPLEVRSSSPSQIYEEAEQETLATADLAVCFISSASPYAHYALGAFRAFLTPSILLTTEEQYPFHPTVPEEYQPRVVSRTRDTTLRALVRKEVSVFEEEYVDLADQVEVEHYADLLIREASPRGQYTDDLRGIFVKELVMGDKYERNQGVMGREVIASHMNFTQAWAQASPDVDLNQLARELATLRREMKKEATTAEQDASIGQLALAESAATQGDGPGVLARLAEAGKWALDVATKIGTTVAAAAIKSSLGI